jgi:hypothetical protein
MKIRAIGLLLLISAAITGAAQPAKDGGQSFAVLLNNPESSAFHFVLDPPELASFDPGSSVFANVVYDYFLESPAGGPTLFRTLTPGATLRLKDLAEGTHLLVGFFALPGRRDYPVRILQLMAGGGLAERFYTVYAEPSLFRARAGRGRLVGFPAEGSAEVPASPGGSAAAKLAPSAPKGELGLAIDNDFADWEPIPILRSFADYGPRTFLREQIGGGRLELPLEQSRFWQKAGTALYELKVVDNGPNLYLYVSTRSAMAEGLSIYLYFRDPRDREGENRVTVELLPAVGDKAGLVALWVKGYGPVAAGTLASGVFFLEAALDKATVYGALASGPQAGYLELTTGYHDRGSLSYEEFYYTRLALKDLPTPDTLFNVRD